jgi:hypothetical protein
MMLLKTLASIKCCIKMFVYFLNIICYAGISIVKMPELNSLLLRDLSSNFLFVLQCPGWIGERRFGCLITDRYQRN